ncbi:chemotaxis protein CheW [Chamaesiphon sp. VAR_69_metabat_338]|uniref:chemotaxis protein CheW n=1 Tax=Chamaesiphon sp. VAR_69_metabat_338 TaxID=2964704 RepID=UPI00286E5951|nr:chemotaxis protein CheW [Chamaesiphon sp. VAR_69_metabat_338]
MAIYSPLRSRRLATRQAEATQRLITFKLGTETFALPLDRVRKVTTIDALGSNLGQRLYGDPNNTGVSLTTFQGRELVVIDVGHRIFRKSQSELLPTAASNRAPAPSDPEIRYLLILQPETAAASEDRPLVGLPIDSPPSIQSVQLSAFKPLPDIYQQHSNIHCVSEMSIDLPDRPAIFLLDVASLAAPV